jgi:hypothetical protein
LLALDLSRCASVTPADVRDAAGVELRRSVAVALSGDLSGGASGSPPRTSATTVVRVTCDGLRAAIDIVDPLTGKTVTRVVDLNAAAPVARAHLLALAIVELLSASWLELETVPRTGAPPVAAVSAPEARAEALELVRARPVAALSRRLMLTFAALVPVGSDAGPRLWGGGLAAAGDAAHRLGWMADLSIAHGSRDRSLGVVTVETVSGLLAVFGHASRSRVTLRGGVGARAGGAWLSGMPADPDTAVGGAVRGLWWGPVLLADGNVVLGRRVVVGLTLEAGRTISPVTARVQGENPVVIGGTWLRGALGVGLAL